MPADDDEALTAMERLSKVTDGPNPKLTELGGKTNGTAVLRLTLPDGTVTAQIVKVLEIAARHRLVVFDDENGMCFMPDGSVFPEDLREGWAADLEELRDPDTKPPDNRTLLQKIAGELFDAIGRGNNHQS